MVEFAAAYGVIVEIIGSTRLRSYGASLRGVIPLKSLGETRTSITRWTWANFRFVFSWFGSEAEQKALEETNKLPRGDMVSLIITGVFVVSASIYFLQEHLAWWEAIGIAIAIAPFAFFLLGPSLTYVVFMLVNLLGLILDIILFRSAAKVLDYEHLATFVKIGSLILLAVGFHFDLLAT